MYLNSCLIRCFKPADIKEVIDVNHECLLENYPDQFFLGLHHHAPKSFLVAVIGDRVIGYIMCRIERKWAGYNQIMGGHIISLAVIPEHKRSGVGTRLIEASVKAMKSYGVDEVNLEMRTTSEEALLFYKKHGFKIKKTMKKYYKDGTDAYYMIKKC
jgi:ribosomal-protein-alanine N-acetyltransferase